MSPPPFDSRNLPLARRSRRRDGSSSRSPSNAPSIHRHAPDRRSGRDAKYNEDIASKSTSHRSRRHGDTDRVSPESHSSSVSPPPAKRRRRSESRSRSSPARRHRHRDRSRSPYRQEKKNNHGDGRDRSNNPHRKDKRSKRRESPDGKSQSPPRRDSRPSKRDGERSAGRSRSRDPDRRSRKPLPAQEVAFRGELDPEAGAVDAPIEKQKPNFANTGLLAKEANTVAGTKIVLKYNEPPEARKPPSSQKWQLYVFKGDDIVDEVPLYTQSCWLLGREAAVADIHTEHPSSSKQHAVIQFRHSVKMNEFGDKQNIVRPYLIDLESANGTKLNGDKIKDSRYYEIRDKDMVKIGLSEREYVFMLPPSN